MGLQTMGTEFRYRTMPLIQISEPNPHTGAKAGLIDGHPYRRTRSVFQFLAD